MKHPQLIQEISKNKLILNSSSKEIGANSSIELNLDCSKKFTIRCKVRISSEPHDNYMYFHFGMLQRKKGTRLILNQKINTNYQASYFYYGFSNTGEIFVGNRKKGKDIDYRNQYSDLVRVNDFNTLQLQKLGNEMHYTLNGNLIFNLPFKRLAGDQLGFSTAAMGSLQVAYLKIDN